MQRAIFQSSRQRGFTLVEVLVALFIMAILAGMAWQGIDALVRTRDGAQRNTDRALQIATVMAQWEQDLAQLQGTAGIPPLRFDGNALHLSRRSVDGMVYVVWTVQGRMLYRWTSPPATRLQELQEWAGRGQQWATQRDTALAMLEDVEQWQVYFYRDGDNAWSNAQSTGSTLAGVAARLPQRAGSQPAGQDNEDSDNPSQPGAGADGQDQTPAGVRLVLTLPSGTLTRDLILSGSQ